MKVKKILIEAEDEIKKEDDAEEVQPEAEAKVEEKPAEEAKAEEVKTEEAEAPAEGESKAEEAKVEEAPAEEAKVEKPEEPAKEVADKVEMKKANDEEIVVKLDFSDFKEQFEKMVSPIIEKVDALTTKVEGIAKAAPTEGAADGEETHTEVAEKSEKTEEAPKEEVKKSDTSSEGASGTENKLLKMIEEMKKSLEDRLTKVESQPAPSKVVVVRKGEDSEEESELQKVDSRLAEIAKQRDTDPATYMRNTDLVDEALKLVEKRRNLTKTR